MGFCIGNIVVTNEIAIMKKGMLVAVQNILPSHLLSKNIKNKIYNTILSPVILGDKTWSLTLKKEYRLKVFWNRVLRRIFRHTLRK
jgi:hypothetical protein